MKVGAPKTSFWKASDVKFFNLFLIDWSFIDLKNSSLSIFKPLINELEQICRVKYGEKEDIDTAIRVVVDHVRAIAFSIADGQLPSNNGAGYVIRRILRRGVRYGYTFLNQKNPFIYKLVKKLSFQSIHIFMFQSYDQITRMSIRITHS